MENTSPCLFWPQDIGPYMTELSHLYCELNSVVNAAEASTIVRHHLLGLPNYANAILSRLRYRAYLLVFIDLLRQDWQYMCRQGRIYLLPPSWIERVRGSEAVQKQKAAIRASLNYERLAQLKKPSVQDFIRKMERTHLFKGKPVSIFSLYANGEELANDLVAVQNLSDEETRTEEICRIIQPYLQQVTPSTRCKYTGFLLNDIWRYIRHTWSIPYNATPGRNMFYLVRDAARPFHPIIGIAALGSSLVQLTARDNVIGWTLHSTLNRIKCTQFRADDAQKIVYMLRSTLQAALADLASDDLDISSGELMNPTEEILIHLKAEAKESREKRIVLLQRLRSLDDQKSSNEASLFPDQLENVIESTQYIEYQINHYLFKAKRAETLFWLLSAKSALDSCPFDIGSVEGLRAFISNHSGRQTLQTLIRENKKRKVGINIMDIIVCGAVPPYNFILGGKLVAMLMMSPQVIYEYEQKYKHHISDIASKMKNDVVYKDPKLVFLGTTSLYHSGSSQYNRISIPLPGGKYQMRYENYGKTLGFGSVHYSEETIKAFKELQEHKNDARLINNRFGEGVNPKLRRIRTGLAYIGLEKSDHFLNHRSKRIIYGVPLGKSAYEFLRGEAENPEYFFDLSSLEAIEKGTRFISEFWAKRWLLMRINNQQAMHNVASFNKADIALSANFDDGPAFTEDLQQIALFGGVTL
jgi:hypothetical protein